MDNNYTILEELIKNISTNTKLDEGEICKAVGRNPGYIAQLRSRYKKNGDTIPSKFIELLRLHFLMDERNQSFDSNSKFSKDEKIAALMAAIKIITLELVQLKHKQTGESVASISIELETMMQSEKKRLLAES